MCVDSRLEANSQKYIAARVIGIYTVKRYTTITADDNDYSLFPRIDPRLSNGSAYVSIGRSKDRIDARFLDRIHESAVPSELNEEVPSLNLD